MEAVLLHNEILEERHSALALALWGLWMLAFPHFSNSVYFALEALFPRWIWAMAFLGVGLWQGGAIWKHNVRWRLGGILVMAGLWAIIGLLSMFHQFAAPATVVIPTWVWYQFRTYRRLYQQHFDSR